MTNIYTKTVSLILLLTALQSPVFAQSYEQSSDALTLKGTPGIWHGKHKFLDVYCVAFPDPNRAIQAVDRMFNKNAISLFEVLYPEKLLATIVVSTIPAGRPAAEEITRLLSIEKNAEVAYKYSYGITEGQTKFGSTINLRIKDVAPGGKSAPFPLVRPVYKPPKTPIESLSVHRIFVHGSNRFEVAVFQFAPENATVDTESDMDARLKLFADQIVQSLQRCTEELPASK